IQAGRLCTSPANCPKTCTPDSLATRISSFRYTQPSAMSTGFLTHSTHVVQTTEYAAGSPRHFEAIERLHADHFGHHRPTSTVVGVVDLALPEQLVEIAA